MMFHLAFCQMELVIIHAWPVSVACLGVALAKTEALAKTDAVL